MPDWRVGPRLFIGFDPPNFSSDAPRNSPHQNELERVKLKLRRSRGREAPLHLPALDYSKRQDRIKSVNFVAQHHLLTAGGSLALGVV